MNTLDNPARGRSVPSPNTIKLFFLIFISLKVFIQTLQKSQDRHEISFSFECNNENIKKSRRAKSAPPPDTIQVDLHPDTIWVNAINNVLLYHLWLMQYYQG